MSPKIFSPEEKDAREQEMLGCAKLIIRDEGLAGLTIDKLVKQLPYSKGTVYTHFSSKEDIMLAICTERMQQIGEIMARALTFNGNSREKALAVHVGSMLNSQAYPDDFMIGVSVKSAGCTSKASEFRRLKHQQIEMAFLAPIFAHFRSAAEAGESIVPAGMCIEQMAFSCWSADFGVQTLLMGDNDACSIRSQLNVETELLNSINLIHDGMCWQPLAKDFDWKASVERIKTEIFSAEVEIISQLQTSLNTL